MCRLLKIIDYFCRRYTKKTEMTISPKNSKALTIFTENNLVVPEILLLSLSLSLSLSTHTRLRARVRD
jgi:hypothetical protein